MSDPTRRSTQRSHVYRQIPPYPFHSLCVSIRERKTQEVSLKIVYSIYQYLPEQAE
uniref:Uncharacterized protein n=1 Tax=Anopheles albimanus TaxID=7167 RepID=A0A182FYJ5_ANOAL